jgi:hypothetical protein
MVGVGQPLLLSNPLAAVGCPAAPSHPPPPNIHPPTPPRPASPPPPQVWPLAGLINYRYIPLQYRVLFINLVALCW